MKELIMAPKKATKNTKHAATKCLTEQPYYNFYVNYILMIFYVKDILVVSFMSTIS